MIENVIKFFGNKIALLVLMLGLTVSVDAAHIVGGTLTYDCISVSNNLATYVITCELYRDTKSNGAGFDDPANFGVYIQNGSGGWDFYDVITGIDLGQVVEIGFEDDICVDEPSDDVGVESGTYTFTLGLPVSNMAYMISYQRCCRNNSISNISSPGSTGIALTIEISPEAQQFCNDSPIWNEFPPIFICNGKTLSIDQSATDSDGDSLVYRFCSPLAAGGTDGSTTPGNASGCEGVTPSPIICGPPYDPVNFIAPLYSPQFPLNGDPLVNIGLMDGFINGVPNISGQFSVGVCVEEYRNGIKIGEVKRDFQFNVLDCIPLVFADIDGAEKIGDQSYFIQSCGESTISIKNLSTRIDHIVSYEWVFDLGTYQDTLDTRDVTYTFPDIGTYQATMILNKGLDCADTVDMTIGIFPDLDSDFNFVYDTCVAGPVAFTDLSVADQSTIIDWGWDFEEGTAQDQNPAYTFVLPGDKVSTLIVTDDNNCKDTTEKIIQYYPAPAAIIVEPNAFIGCAPANISFDNLTTPINESYNIEWDFGDGTTSNEISPNHMYDNPGVYSIKVSITSPLDCYIEDEFLNWIQVKESPIADYIFTPTKLNSFNKLVEFTDLSIDAETWQWSFGGDGFSQIQNPTHEFRDTGSYAVQLVAFHENGCTDTLIQFLDVEPLSTFFFPNAFTPNFDGNNETFKGKGVVDGIEGFEMSIWNRWGELVFQSNDINVGWDGRKNNSGDLSPGGVYVYTYSIKGARNKVIEGNGVVTLVR